MILLFSFLLVAIGLVVLGCICADKDWDDSTAACFVFSFVLFLIVIGMLISIPTARRDDRVFIEEVKVAQITLNNFREKKYDFDRASVVKDVITMNRKIAELKYDNSSIWWWDWWTDDSVDNLELIK